MQDDESQNGEDAPAGVLGARPDEDAMALEVARARIANALFATEEQVRIGRYQLLQRAGAGGMGVIWSAWDPELDRRVAIKLMHARSEAARDTLLREGQSLARLSHPNIVPIYDVGSAGDQVYLVIEWIAGETVRAFGQQPRSTKELVAIYLAAGAGVMAAHRAGIVHRDFKPDNVMIGDDGRVRVLDFGLAHASERSDGSSSGAIAGTPRYMAPEQASGAATTPASDQYSFGVSLRESLSARGAVPAWIAQVIERATAAAPEARYPDMDALLAALARDPARIWRRRAAVAAAVLAAAAAFAVGAARHRAEIDLCSGAPAELAAIWNPARTEGMVVHVRTLGEYGSAEAGPLADQLSAYGARWIAARRGACLALQRNDVTPALYERGLACLERSRSALDAVTTALARSPLERLPESVLAARNLPDAERCLAEATTDPVAPPRAELAARVSSLGARVTRASYLALAADPASAALARTAVGEAEQIGYAPLLARAQIALGAALSLTPGSPTVAAYAAASEAALQGGDDATFVEAFARQLFAASQRGDAAVAQLVAALPFVTSIARRTGDGGRFARALLYNNAATERLAAGDRDAAIAWLRQARAEPLPAERAAELWIVLGNLAMLVPDRAEREALFAEERAQLERTLGAEHPFTFAVRERAALFIEDPRQAIARLGELCPAYARLHPQKRDDLVHCHYELAWLEGEAGEREPASAAYRHVVELAAPADPRSVLARAELARLSGDPAAAIALAEPLARATEHAAQWWNRIPAADAWLAVGAARDARGERTAATQAWRSARRVLDEVHANTSTTTVMRRRAFAGARLALATRDRAIAAEAIGWYRSAGGYDAAIAALRW
jgi:eukaryotic-like serine/threonine-protein kinase